MAAGFLYHQARLRSIDTLIVASAGFGPPDQRISRPVVSLLEDRGVDVERKRTRQLTADMVAYADLIVTMTVDQARRAEVAFPEAASKIFTLRHLSAVVTTRPDGIGAEVWMRELQRTTERAYGRADSGGDSTLDIAEPTGTEFGAMLNLADQLLAAIDHLVRCIWPRAQLAAL